MKQKISKTQLIDLVYDSVKGVQLKQVDAVVNSFLEKLSDALSNGSSVEMRGFGSFDVVPSKSRIKTDSENKNKKSWRVKFKAGKKLKANVKKIPVEEENEKN